MKRVGFFMVGFASGWVVRSTLDSSRGLVVGAVSTFYGTVERLRRLVAIEREHLEDLVAEGRAKYEARRSPSNDRPSGTGDAGPAATVSPSALSVTAPVAASAVSAVSEKGARPSDIPRRGRAA